MDGISITKNEAMSVEIAYHTRKGMKENVAQRDPATGYCYKNGGPAAYGYQNVRVTRGKDIVKLLWEADDEKKEVVRKMALELWLERNWTWKMIRDWLNGQGIPSARGGLWNTSSIREICLRALEGEYTGTGFWNRTSKSLRGTGQKWKDPDEWIVVEDAHPAIITREELEVLRQAKGPEVQKRKGKGANNPRAVNSPWLLSGPNAIGEPFFRCLACGGHLVSAEGNGYKWYLCANYKNYGPTGCEKPVWVEKQFELAVVKAITNRFTEENVKELVSQTNKFLQEEQKDIQAARRHVEKEIEKNSRGTRELMDTIKQAGTKSKVILLAELEALAEHKEALEQQLIELEKEQPQAKPLDEQIVLDRIQSIEQTMAKGTNKEKRDFIRAFIHSIEFDPDEGQTYINFFADPFRTTKVKTGDSQEPPVSILDGGDTRICYKAVELSPRKYCKMKAHRVIIEKFN